MGASKRSRSTRSELRCGAVQGAGEPAAQYRTLAIMKPTLHRPGFRLVPAMAIDLDRVCALLWDADVRRYLCDDEILPRERIAGFLDDSARLDAQGFGLWTIEPDNGVFAGIVGLMPVAHEAAEHPLMHGGIEPTIAVHRQSWGAGLATRTLDCLLDYARTDHGLDRMVANVDEPNVASHRLMKRCGFRETGRGQGRKYRLVFYERLLPATL
jgi:RimJ/RimL family protein N-acetyltransferase